jgi:N-acetylmuramoyl-L-alanine amidase
VAKKKTTDIAPRTINLIVLHCSDSDNPAHDNVETIRKWHTERGFTGPDGIPGTEDDIGYHFVITQNGQVHKGRDVEKIGAHCKDHNAHSIGICLTGSHRESFSRAQFASLRKLIDSLLAEHRLDWKAVRLHNQLDSHKTCPNFTMADAVSG